MFKEELPNLDSCFKYQAIKLKACYRPGMIEFLNELSKHFEVVAWSSSKLDYTQEIVKMIEDSAKTFKFDHVLSIENQMASVDGYLHVKNIELLSGEGGRKESDIIIIDTSM